MYMDTHLPYGCSFEYCVRDFWSKLADTKCQMVVFPVGSLDRIQCRIGLCFNVLLSCKRFWNLIYAVIDMNVFLSKTA